jgi:signal transduction histidine kinase
VNWRRVGGWLAPGAAERDVGFDEEILSISHRGMAILGWLETAIALIALAGVMPWRFSFPLLILGLATAGAGRISAAYSYSRGLAAVSAGLGAAISLRAEAAGASEDFALGIVTVLLVAAAAAVPLLPLQSFGIGIMAVVAGTGGEHVLFLAMMTLVATAIAAALYAQRRANYASYVGVLQATQDLRDTQSQLLRGEHSATMVRLSAALAHELSSPIGTVSSGIDTLLLLCARQAETPPAGQARLLALESDLGRSLRESLARLKTIVNRIQRLTNLDEAVTRRASVNDLIQDAVGLVKPQVREGVDFVLDLGSVPEITCRPQQLIAVFCNLLLNSIQAIDGEGQVSIASRRTNGRLEVEIADNGRGIAPERMAHIFDPGFRVADGRVSTGNWSLFTSRQLIQDSGGDIRIQSTEGKGTTVSLTLPCAS